MVVVTSERLPLQDGGSIVKKVIVSFMKYERRESHKMYHIFLEYGKFVGSGRVTGALLAKEPFRSMSTGQQPLPVRPVQFTTLFRV